MVQSAGFDPVFAVTGSSDERRPPEREPDSTRVTPATELETSSPDSRRRADAPEAPARPTRVAFTAKFGPDSDGFPLQLISGDQVTIADTFDAQGIAENRVARQESRTALLQAQETRDAVANETERQQETAAARREEQQTARPEPESRQPEESNRPSGSFLDLQV